VLLVIAGLVVISAIAGGANAGRSGSSSDTTATTKVAAATTTSKATTTTTVAAVTTTSKVTTTTRKVTTTTAASDSTYRAAVISITTPTQEAMDTIGYLGSTFPAWSDDDMLQYAAALFVLRAMKDDLDKLTPPPAWREAHGYLTSAAVYFNKFSYSAAEGIDEMDASKLSKAANLMQLGTAEIIKAAAAIP